MSDEIEKRREQYRESVPLTDPVRKRGQQAIAGLIDDPAALEQERERQAAPARPRTSTARAARPTPRWIPLHGGGATA